MAYAPNVKAAINFAVKRNTPKTRKASTFELPEVRGSINPNTATQYLPPQTTRTEVAGSLASRLQSPLLPISENAELEAQPAQTYTALARASRAKNEQTIEAIVDYWSPEAIAWRLKMFKAISEERASGDKERMKMANLAYKKWQDAEIAYRKAMGMNQEGGRRKTRKRRTTKRKMRRQAREKSRSK